MSTDEHAPVGQARRASAAHAGSRPAPPLDLLSRFTFARAVRHPPVMLMYHSVQAGSGAPDWPWAVSLAAFRAQLDLLQAEGYVTPTMSELVAAPGQFGGRTAVITFDDGYVDNLVAFDELVKRGLRASWFVVAGSVGREPDWPADGRPGGRLIDAAELRMLQQAGMEVGSHTMSHVRLPTVDDERLSFELTASKDRLEQHLGEAVTSLAYPYGAWDARCAAAARRAGYAAACTTRTGWALRDGNPFTLRRLTVLNTDTLGTVARKLCLGTHAVAWRDLAAYGLRRRLPG